MSQPTLAKDRSAAVQYNLGLQLLLVEQPEHAFACFQVRYSCSSRLCIICAESSSRVASVYRACFEYLQPSRACRRRR